MHTTWRPPPNTLYLVCVFLHCTQHFLTSLFVPSSTCLHMIYVRASPHRCKSRISFRSHLSSSTVVPETELRSSGLLGEYFSPRRDFTFIISNTQRRSLYPYSLAKTLTLPRVGGKSLLSPLASVDEWSSRLQISSF